MHGHTHIHIHTASMHQKHLLRFIKKKLKTEKDRYIDMYVRMCVYVCSGGGLEVGFFFQLVHGQRLLLAWEAMFWQG